MIAMFENGKITSLSEFDNGPLILWFDLFFGLSIKHNLQKDETLYERLSCETHRDEQNQYKMVDGSSIEKHIEMMTIVYTTELYRLTPKDQTTFIINGDVFMFDACVNQDVEIDMSHLHTVLECSCDVGISDSNMLEQVLSTKIIPDKCCVPHIKSQETMDALIKHGLLMDKETIIALVQKSLYVDPDVYDVEIGVDLYRAYSNRSLMYVQHNEYVKRMKGKKELNYEIRENLKRGRRGEDELLEKIKTQDVLCDYDMYEDAVLNGYDKISEFMETEQNIKPKISICIKIDDKNRRLEYYEKIEKQNT